MTETDPPKDQFELNVRHYDLANRTQAFEEHKFEQENRSILRRLPVVITVIAGASAIVFQGLSTVIAYLERGAAAVRSERDFDFKALEFVVNRRDDLITCDAAMTQKNLDALTPVVSDRVKPALKSLVDGGVRKCAASAQASAQASTSPAASGKAQDQTAYYRSLQKQAGVLASTAATGPGNEAYRVFLQYQDPADQTRAVDLRTKLQANRYSAPGIQRVSVAPAHYEVRYYRDEDAAVASRVANLVKDTLHLDAAPATASLQKLYPNLPGRSIEVWFPAPRLALRPEPLREAALYVGNFPSCREARSYAMRVGLGIPLDGGMRNVAVLKPDGTYGAYILGNPPYTRAIAEEGCEMLGSNCEVTVAPTVNAIPRC